MGPIGCTETSVRNYHYSLCNDPEERSCQEAARFHPTVDSLLLYQTAYPNHYFVLVYLGMVLERRGAPGGVMVEAIRYNPAGRGIDSRWCHWNFSVT